MNLVDGYRNKSSYSWKVKVKAPDENVANIVWHFNHYNGTHQEVKYMTFPIISLLLVDLLYRNSL